MIWNEPMETMSAKDLASLQSERLQTLVQRVYQQVPFYRNRFDSMKLKPESIRSISDLQRLPFTRKNDLRDHYPFGLFAVPRNEIVRIHASSGTTGKPTVVGYTRNDIEHWAEVCARSLALAGALPGQMFQNAYGYGLFTGGLGMHYGAEKMGMTVIPVSGGNSARQIMLLQDFGTDVLAATPSYALALADRLRNQGIRPGDLALKTLVLGAEPWTEGMRDAIEQRLQVSAVNIYGLSEIIGPGVSNECVEAKDGSHVFEDHFIVEVIDPTTGQPLSDGSVGELVFTTLTKEALPLIRYRTGDLAYLNREPCRCGRTHARMSRIVGRTDDMLIVRGVNVFPSQIESALMGMEQLSPHHQIIVSREQFQDELEVRVEITEALNRSLGEGEGGDEVTEHLEGEVNKRLYETLGINVKVSLWPPNTLPRSQGGKLKRVEDQREI